MKFNWVNEDYPSSCPVYFELAYLNLFAAQNRSTAKVLRIESGQGVAWLPLELRQIGPDRWEASSAYGYGGLFSAAAVQVSLHEWHHLMDFLASQKIICVFLRHAPFLQNHLFWPTEKRTTNRKTYARTLQSESTLAGLCADIDQKLRWSIHAALRQNLQVEFHGGPNWNRQDVAAFYDIYQRLMHEKQTNPFYVFSEQFLLDHATAFGAQCELALVRNAETRQIMAGAIFLLDKKDDDNWVHYHLSASERSASSGQAVELLVASAIVHYGNRGYRHLHLGGGHSLEETDGLSRFKKKFSTSILNYEISTWICDEQAYMVERNRLALQHPSHFLIHDSRGAM